MKKYKNKIIGGVIILAVLAIVFWWGGNAPGLRGWNPESQQVSTDAENDSAVSPTPAENAMIQSGTDNMTDNSQTDRQDSIQAVDTERETSPEESQSQEREKQQITAYEKNDTAGEIHSGEQGDEAYSKSRGMEIQESTGQDQYKTEPVPAGKPIPVEPENAVITDKKMTCTLSVRCDTVLQHMEWMDPGKAEIIPADGMIFPEQTVTFYEGESVFNVLLREMKKNKIHLEFTSTPVYHSAYIEGINNLYEFDCGELSGWKYKVNGWFPGFGSSRYQLKQGDKIEWVYTCNLGADIGADYTAGEQR